MKKDVERRPLQSARRRHARNQRVHRAHVVGQHAERRRGSDELRADVDRAGGSIQLMLIPTGAAKKLYAEMLETGNMQLEFVLNVLVEAMQAFDDPTHRSPCALCEQRIGVEDIGWAAILHAKTYQPRAGLARFVCVQCAPPYGDAAMLATALVPRFQRELGRTLWVVAISPPGRA